MLRTDVFFIGKKVANMAVGYVIIIIIKKKNINKIKNYKKDFL